MALKAVIFDLDGTLLDTAPDLAASLNIMLAKHHRSDIPYEQIRPIASHGSKALVKLGFGIDENHPDFAGLRQEYLHIYSEHSGNLTALFLGIVEVLTWLNNQKIAWGIVTNKPGWLTMPLLKRLNLLKQTNCVVSGDTLTTSKPDPAPLLYACTLLNCSTRECIYIGDAEVDIIAGKRAGIKTILAKYGYLSEQDAINQWNPDAIIDSPIEIINHLNC